jgi:hypothetical protein
MHQIAEFIAVLSCALFTGAAVYITFVEHPARMQCGVELAATEFAPSYRRATVMQASCAGLGLLSSLAAWLGGASFWWGGCRSLSGISYSVHADRDPAHQQAIAQPCTGSAVSRSSASACKLGQAARCPEHPQRHRAAAILVFGCLQERWVRAFEILLR